MTVSCYHSQTRKSQLCAGQTPLSYIHRGGSSLVWFKSVAAPAHGKGGFFIKATQVLSKSCERVLGLSPLLINTGLNRNKKRVLSTDFVVRIQWGWIKEAVRGRWYVCVSVFGCFFFLNFLPPL